jgi:type II secretory pathway pseudopilin PulG
VTLTELLVVLVVTGLLATMAVPVAVTRINQSRFSIARAEVQAFAQAEEMAAATHGFYFPLQVLDDTLAPDDILQFNWDDLRNEEENLLIIDANVPVLDQFNNGQLNKELEETNPDPRIQQLFRDWQGPFIQPHRVFIGGGFESPTQGQQVDPILTREQAIRDHPLDPWGRPYRLFSPLGIVGSERGKNPQDTPPTNAELFQPNFSDGTLRVDAPRRFDRWAVVSFGPNGVGDGTTTSGGTAGNPLLGDDIIYLFGRVIPVTETTFAAGPAAGRAGRRR